MLAYLAARREAWTAAADLLHGRTTDVDHVKQLTEEVEKRLTAVSAADAALK